MSEYAQALGTRLRAIRRQQGLSLQGVEQKSQGRWRGTLVGCYERGERAVTAQRLIELAGFYGVPVSELLPPGGRGPLAARASRLVVNLERLRQAPPEQLAPLARYVAAIQRLRGDYNGRVLSLRAEDLRPLSAMYKASPRQVVEQLLDCGVLSPASELQQRPRDHHAASLQRGAEGANAHGRQAAAARRAGGASSVADSGCTHRLERDEADARHRAKTGSPS